MTPYNFSVEQGSGIGGKGVYPPEDFGKIYPPRRREARPPFFGRNSKINANLTGFSLNLVKFRLI